MENPTKMDDLGIITPISSETSSWGFKGGLNVVTSAAERTTFDYQRGIILKNGDVYLPVCTDKGEFFTSIGKS